MGQLTTKADVAVIGGGPGGYTAAIRAAQLGLETVLIEKDKLGGLCTNAGCIPSKALMHAADVYHDAISAGDMGIAADVKLDFAGTQRWKNGVVENLRNGIATLCRLNGVEVIDGKATFTSSSTLTVETEAGLRTVEFKKAVIATGTQAKELPGMPMDHKGIIGSDDAFALAEVPRNITIVGGGYIAVEMACLFSKLGSRVTVLYRGQRLLRQLEPEITEALLKGMSAAGIEVLLESSIGSVDGNVAVVKTPSGVQRIEFDKLLVAAGRTVELQGLGLDRTRVMLNEDGLISIDETCKTTDESIYAVGDVTPGPQLAHKAFRQGKVAAECIAGKKSAFDNRAIPMVVFSEPEIATAGMSEEQAKALGRGMLTGRMPFTALGAAKAADSREGFVKIIADGNGIILGVHIAGKGARMLIAEAAFAIEMAATLEDLAATIHAHPTMPEALMEAAEDALGKAIHIHRGSQKS